MPSLEIFLKVDLVANRICSLMINANLKSLLLTEYKVVLYCFTFIILLMFEQNYNLKLGIKLLVNGRKVNA